MIYSLENMEEVDVHSVCLSCVRSYIYYHDTKKHKHIVDKLLLLTGGKWEKAVKWWVSNSARAVRNRATGFHVSLRTSAYSGSVQGIGFRGVKGLLEFLEAKGFIYIYKGFVVQWKVENGKRVPETSIPSCLILRERALALFENVDTPADLFKEQEEQDLIQIRDRKTKEDKSLRGHTGVKEERKKMKEFNDFLSKANITFDGAPIADVVYKRVFSDDLSFGGRLYAVGGSVQLLPQHLRRSSLRIDDEEVVELDYSAIHPNICYQMMYNKEGLNVYDVLGEDFSPYSADLSFVDVCPELKAEIEALTGEKHDPIRSLAKLAILISMNSKDLGSAVSGLSMKILQDRKKPVKDQDFYAIKGSIPARRVCDAVQYHNDLIGHHFFSDAGMVLQHIDSNIMLDIVSTMIQKGHSVLCYHDSAVVKKSAEGDLYQAMFSAWKNVLGDTTFCKIDRK